MSLIKANFSSIFWLGSVLFLLKRTLKSLYFFWYLMGRRKGGGMPREANFFIIFWNESQRQKKIAYVFVLWGFPGGAHGKEPACQCRRYKRHRFYPWVRKIPWRRTGQPTPVFLPGKSHRTEEPGGLQSIGLQRAEHNWACMHACPLSPQGLCTYSFFCWECF